MRITVLFVFLLMSNRLWAQTCSALGQTPATAFPVCGVATFHQSTVPECYSHSLTVPGCSGSGGANYQDKNPYWYRFTCYQTGTLGFLIKPNDMGDDYDWMLYDITGHSPGDVFTNRSLIVTGNWAGTYGLTGASASGISYIGCASAPDQNHNTFSTMPVIQQGHEYLLLISHFSGDDQSGYGLSFGGGTAVITDPLLPKMAESWASCGGVTVTIRLNKKMKCSSLALDASDFVLSSSAASIVSATAVGCSRSFDMDTVVLTMSNALPPANYTITIKNGSDGSTLLDNCDRNIPAGDNIAFTVYPVQPTPMDSLKPVGCAPNTVQLVFRKPMNCNSIAADGSDFTISGPTPVAITGASGKCVNGVTSSIFVQLSAPIQTAGNYQIHLQRGNDGNNLIDECGQETPASSLPFATSDTVNADFTYQILYGCKFDTVNYIHPGNNGVNTWNWNFDNIGRSTLQNPSFVFSTFGPKQTQLIVSNGVCKDTAVTTVLLDNELKAEFAYPDILCPQDKAVFTDHSIGKIIAWNWDFGNGSYSVMQNPLPETYPTLTNIRSKLYTVQLIVENNLHCFDTVSHQVKSVNSCYITVPNAFTPNHDGLNDYLYPLNAWKAVNLEFIIYNRYGQVIFRTTDWTKRWDGTINGAAQSSGVFVWLLRYTDRETGEKYFKRGTTVLIK